MAKVTLAPEFESLSGKLCSKSKTVIALNSRTGRMYRYDYHDREYSPSDNQLAVQSTFTERSKAASTWWQTNKGGNTDAYQALVKAYKSQTKYGNPYSYLRSLVAADLTITVPGATTSGTTTSGTTTGGTPTTPTEGGDEA